jgi:hypothetical protein
MTDSTQPPVTVPPEIVRLFAEIAALGPQDADKPKKGLRFVTSYVGDIPRRRRFMKLYGWAVPTPEAVARIVAFVDGRRVIEVGAGNGLWARLISSLGVTVTATDDYTWCDPGSENSKANTAGFQIEAGAFYPVERLDAAEAVARHADHKTLLVVWPPPDRPMAYDALHAFKGDQVVYIGDPACTADDAFRNELLNFWRCDDIVAIPRWTGINDSVFLYERKPLWQQRPPARQREHPARMSS